ncbi:hypothetical protein AQUCO_00200914v1 [Aquilegia coerulea]|uniref:Uncharacterized protein n=1 Tax=Aquilegia coerulea TaxID=218851 RepID=A0A2G5F5C4_AQUCA|nr:hypothetical protein AQUCO_00200914v1 [Aquilegia coerulea]
MDHSSHTHTKAQNTSVSEINMNCQFHSSLKHNSVFWHECPAWRMLRINYLECLCYQRFSTYKEHRKHNSINYLGSKGQKFLKCVIA